MSGVPPTLESMYRAEFKAVCGFLWRLGARESEMDDLAHDVFMTAARRLNSFDSNRPARPWLFGIAFRVFSDHRRTAREHLQAEVPDTLEDPAEGADRTVERRQAQALLQRALATLPEERRVAFVLHDLEGLTPTQVAEAMDAPLPTTYSRIKTARDEVLSAVRRFQLVEQSKGGA